jgi:hypothetical protein
MKDGATTENLKYLGSEQALADLRQFILWMKGLTPNQPDGASTPSVTVRYGMRDSTVTVVGGSYPGALAAWAKLKHGDVIDGAISRYALDLWRTRPTHTVLWNRVLQVALRFC